MDFHIDLYTAFVLLLLMLIGAATVIRWFVRIQIIMWREFKHGPSKGAIE